MGKKFIVPIETWGLGSPELKIGGKNTDLGLLAEALILFDEVVVNVQIPENITDLIKGFIEVYGDLSPLYDLIDEGIISFHYFDFLSTPIFKDGKYFFANVQDKVATESHLLSFQQKLLYNDQIDTLIPRSRHRSRFLNTIAENTIVDGAEDYAFAIEASRESLRSNESTRDIEFLLNSFVESLPIEYKSLFPSQIKVIIEELIGDDLTQNYNFNLKEIGAKIPNLNFGDHIPWTGLTQSYRFINASRNHNFDVYLPNPISGFTLEKMKAFSYDGKKFKQTTTQLHKEDNFPDIRTSFNTGQINWKDVLKIRGDAEKFRHWFAINAGNPEVGLKTYGEEFKACIEQKPLTDKYFSICEILGTIGGTAIEQATTGTTSLVGPVSGNVVGKAVPFIKDLFKGTDEEGWKPRFFGNYISEEINKKKMRK